jgi:hypothetical protein
VPAYGPSPGSAARVKPADASRKRRLQTGRRPSYVTAEELRVRTNRKAPRTSLTAEVLLRRSGHRNYRVNIYDVSLEGCKIEFIERPNVGERLWVKFEALDAVEGSVCWLEGHLAGVKFERPIHPAVFEILVSRMTRPRHL